MDFFSLFKGSKPVYALEIKVNAPEWKDLSKKQDIEYLKEIEEFAFAAKYYAGEFVVYDDNTLARDFIHNGLEKKTGIIDLADINIQSAIKSNGIVSAKLDNGEIICYNKNKIFDFPFPEQRAQAAESKL